MITVLNMTVGANFKGEDIENKISEVTISAGSEPQYVISDNILKGILVRNGQSVFELDITPKGFSSFFLLICCHLFNFCLTFLFLKP